LWPKFILILGLTLILIKIVIHQRIIPAREWSKSHHVTFTNTHCSPRIELFVASVTGQQ